MKLLNRILSLFIVAALFSVTTVSIFHIHADVAEASPHYGHTCGQGHDHHDEKHADEEQCGICQFLQQSHVVFSSDVTLAKQDIFEYLASFSHLSLYSLEQFFHAGRSPPSVF